MAVLKPVRADMKAKRNEKDQNPEGGKFTFQWFLRRKFKSREFHEPNLDQSGAHLALKSLRRKSFRGFQNLSGRIRQQSDTKRRSDQNKKTF